MKTNYPDSLTIQQYLDGKLDPEVAHQLEKQALEDPFLWDALEGYSTYRDPAADLSILQRQLHERIVHLQENKKVFDLTWQRLSVAAAAAVMFISAGILFWMNSQKSPEQLASQSKMPVEVNVVDRDTLETVITAKDEPLITSLAKKDSESDKPTVSVYKPVNPTDSMVVSSSLLAESTIAATIETEPLARSSAALSTASEVQEAKNTRIGDVKVSLNEVVVRSENTPKSGWPSYRKYLDRNTEKFKARPRLKGSVLLFFQVGTDGRPTNITVVRSMNEAYDQEAIRIVKVGPEWTVAPDGKTHENRLEVSFQ